MPAMIHCIRHAQGFHNLGVQFHQLPDPKLTPVGIEQCLNAKSKVWRDQSKLSLITASPLSRTIHTASVVFADALSNGKARPHILAIPDAQETSDFPCDTGSDLDILKSICAEQNWLVDLSLVEDGWNTKSVGSRYSPNSQAIKSRARDTRALLRLRVKELEASGDANPQIVLVSHGGYLHYFTEDWEDSNKLYGTGWQNCESRSYVFESGDDDQEAHLVETMESRHRRGIEYPMLPKDKQSELFEKSMQQWKDQGLQDASKVADQEHQSVELVDMAKKLEIKAVV